LLADYTIESALETTLGANQWAASASRFSWMSTDDNNNKKWQTFSSSSSTAGRAISVSMEPMEIKTFVISLTRK